MKRSHIFYGLLLIALILQIAILYYVYYIKTITVLGENLDISAVGYLMALSPAIVMVVVIVYFRALRK
jgi:hypothetical protein